MTAKVKDTDHGLKRRLADLHKLKGWVAKIGIQGEQAAAQHEGTTLTNAQIGAVHEFGAPSVGVPQRSFLRATYDVDSTKWTEELKKELATVIKKKGTNYKYALTVVAERLRTAIIDRIMSGIPPALKPSTIAHKGGETTPLLNTGVMVGAITAKVEKAGASE